METIAALCQLPGRGRAWVPTGLGLATCHCPYGGYLLFTCAGTAESLQVTQSWQSRAHRGRDRVTGERALRGLVPTPASPVSMRGRHVGPGSEARGEEEAFSLYML